MNEREERASPVEFRVLLVTRFHRHCLRTVRSYSHERFQAFPSDTNTSRYSWLRVGACSRHLAVRSLALPSGAYRLLKHVEGVKRDVRKDGQEESTHTCAACELFNSLHFTIISILK